MCLQPTEPAHSFFFGEFSESLRNDGHCRVKYKKFLKNAFREKIKLIFSSNNDTQEVLENFRQLGEERTDNDLIESRIFELSKNKFGFLDVQRFIRATRKTGLNLLSDPRLTDTR